MRKRIIFLVLLALLAVPMMNASAAGGNTIVDIAVADGRFTTLVAAVQAAGLADALAGPGPLTVFAPTDAAFAKLGQSTINALLNDIPTLKTILLYHVAAGDVRAATVTKLSYATTLQGSDVTIEVRGGKVFLNGNAQVIITDIVASNGVIHVIDTVILPPSFRNDLVLVAADTPILSSPNGEPTGLVLEKCKTAFVTDRVRGFAKIATQGGWVSSAALRDVAEDYGQPGGQPIDPACR